MIAHGPSCIGHALSTFFLNLPMQQQVLFEDLGRRKYKEIWDYQETLLKQNADIKAKSRFTDPVPLPVEATPTIHYLLFVEHDPVYTLGKNGKDQHVLIDEQERIEKGIEYFHINRGGDITYHGPGQLVAPPQVQGGPLRAKGGPGRRAVVIHARGGLRAEARRRRILPGPCPAQP